MEADVDGESHFAAFMCICNVHANVAKQIHAGPIFLIVSTNVNGKKKDATEYMVKQSAGDGSDSFLGESEIT